MTTIRGEEGSRLYSTLSLRPPLPPVKAAFGTIVRASIREPNGTNDPIDTGTVPTGEQSVSKISSAHDRSTSQLQLHSLSPPFLFRMYVACQVLRLATETRFTALVLLQRYAQAKQERSQTTVTERNREEDWPWIGAVCIFLACKTEDEPRRLRDITNLAQMVLSSPSSSTTTKAEISTTNDNSCDDGTNTIQNEDNGVIAMNLSRPPPLDDAYWNSKKKAIETEQMVLQWLGFDCSVSHPHRAVFWILEKEITTTGDCRPKNDSSGSSETPNRKRKHDAATSRKQSSSNYIQYDNEIGDQLLPLAFKRLNDALFCPRALRWGVIELACAAIELAKDDAADQDGNAAAGDNGTTTALVADATIENESSNSNRSPACSSTKSMFGNEWWRRYEVSNEQLRGCRNNLLEAKSHLRTIATSIMSHPDTDPTHKPS